jgi:hypothetical protein
VRALALEGFELTPAEALLDSSFRALMMGLRFFPLTYCRYLLEEGAQADVHNGGLHRRGTRPLREIRQ